MPLNTINQGHVKIDYPVRYFLRRCRAQIANPKSTPILTIEMTFSNILLIYIYIYNIYLPPTTLSLLLYKITKPERNLVVRNMAAVTPIVMPIVSACLGAFCACINPDIQEKLKFIKKSTKDFLDDAERALKDLKDNYVLRDQELLASRHGMQLTPQAQRWHEKV